MKNILSIAAAIAVMLSGCGRKNGNTLRTLDGVTQGTTYHIVFEPVFGTDSCFEAVRDSVALYLSRIDNALSGYNGNSLLTAFNTGIDNDNCYRVNPTEENRLLYGIFLDNFIASKEMTEASDGLFDVSAAPLFDIWGFGFRNRTEVTRKDIDSVMQFVGMHHFSIGEDGVLKKDDPRCRLNFNAIAQGYTADYIAGKFIADGMRNFLIEVGGEVYAKGTRPDGRPWRVGIDRPEDNNNDPGARIQAVVSLTDKGLVTSGDYRKFYMKEGKKVSHTINPKTGSPIEHNLLSATVIARNATIADAYATYLMVLGLDKAVEVVEKTDGIEALLIYGEQDNMRTWISEGMKSIVTE